MRDCHQRAELADKAGMILQHKDVGGHEETLAQETLPLYTFTEFLFSLLRWREFRTFSKPISNNSASVVPHRFISFGCTFLW